jgi:hypothetical protein
VEGIDERILRQYRSHHDLGSQRINLIAKRHQRNSGEEAESLLSAVRLARASLVNDVLRRHELIPTAATYPPFSGEPLTLHRLG